MYISDHFKTKLKCILNGNNRLRKLTFTEPKGLERETLRYCKNDGKVTFTKPFLILAKMTFDEHVNVLERYCKDEISYTFKNLNGSLSKTKCA